MSDEITFETFTPESPENVINIDVPVQNQQDKTEDEGGTEPLEQPTEDATPATGVEQQGQLEAVQQEQVNTEPDYSEYIKSTTEGKFNSMEEILEALSGLEQEASSEYNFKDDYIKKAVDYYEKNGTLKPFLEAFQLDVDGMSHEELMRSKLRSEYSDLSDSAFQKLYQKEIVSKYNLSEEDNDPEDIEIGKQMLKRDAERIRQEYKTMQEQFLQPEQETSKVDESAELAENWSNIVDSSSVTQSILSDKAITIDIDGEDFNYEVENVNDMLEMTKDNSKFFNLFLNQNGEVDLNKWYKILAFAMEPDVYERSLVNHGKTLGVSDVEKELKNPEVKSTPTGTESSQDWATAFLSAALNQKRK